jgi:hypothetical protein
MDVQFLPLVPGAVLPAAPGATTRVPVPPGYGVQEQCLPFTAATALGLLVRSPIAFGLCAIDEVPVGASAFRSPLETPDMARCDRRVFYIVDDPTCRFLGNAFTFDPLKEPSGRTYTPTVPGISFFDRPDQFDTFKLHLPYICRTSENVDTLFLAPINRRAPFEVLFGLVETDWYANPVNLILRRPPAGCSVHVGKGDAVAQLVFVDRSHRRANVTLVAPHARLARDLKTMMAEWHTRHDADRAAYKRLARSRHGRPDATRDDNSVS